MLASAEEKRAQADKMADQVIPLVRSKYVNLNLSSREGGVLSPQELIRSSRSFSRILLPFFADIPQAALTSSDGYQYVLKFIFFFVFVTMPGADGTGRSWSRD